MIRIYALVDPRDNEVRYVGKTKQTIKKRYQQHLKAARLRTDESWRTHWISKLLRLGYSPRIELLQEVPVTDWRKAEQYWIGYYRSIGCRLTNGTVGGDGGDSFTVETRSKMSEAAVRKFQDPVIMAKYLGNQNSLGRVVSEQERAQTTIRNLARYGLPWECLAEDYERLGTCEKVAAEYGCNEETVRRALHRANIPTKPTQRLLGAKYLWNNKDTLQEAYDRLGTIRAVAESYGCGMNTVHRAMNRLGIQRPITNTGRKYDWTDERRANHKAAINAPGVQEKRTKSRQASRLAD